MQGENERQWKKVNEKNVLLRSFWKFHFVVVQNNAKEMYKKKCAARAKLLFAN